MAFLQSDYVFHDSLRSPTREAHDSQSCAITRGSVPNDNCGRMSGSAGYFCNSVESCGVVWSRVEGLV